MKFLMNSSKNSYQDMVVRVCMDDMSKILEKKGHKVVRNDWKNYDKYDIVFFMSYDAPIDKVKSINANIIIVILDPKLTKKYQINNAKKADLLIVSSVEQYDKFLQYNSNVFIYYMYPELITTLKKHTQKDKIILGYHGNKAHLNNIYPNLTYALQMLGDKYNIELWVIYNKDLLGEWRYGIPNNIKIKHIQWHENVYEEVLPNVDIGLVPNIIHLKKICIFNFLQKYVLSLDKEDYDMRYKYSSNPGRHYVFSKYGIPMVSDMYPSAGQFIFHGYNGELVNSVNGWFCGIERLIKSHELRNLYANRTNEIFLKYASFDNLVDNLIYKIENIKESPQFIQKNQKVSASLISEMFHIVSNLYSLLKKRKR